MKKKFQKTKKTTFSHDSFFKHFYSDPKLARELLELIFSKAELKALDLNKLKIEKDTFEGQSADLIFSVPFKAYPNRKLDFLILLEHKSFYDKNLYEQVLKYQFLIRDHSRKQKGYVQPIIPVLFSHGKQPINWKKTLQEEDFKSFFSKIPVETRKDMLNYGLRIIDTKDPRIRKVYKDKSSKSWSVIKLLDEVWSIKKAPPEKVSDIFVDFEKDILKDLKGKKREETILKIVEYLRDNTGLDWKTWEKTEDLLMEKGILKKGGIMDIRKHIEENGRWKGQREGIRKGRQEGIRKGRQEVILNMLKKKADISFISEVTGLSEKEIKKLQNGA